VATAITFYLEIAVAYFMVLYRVKVKVYHRDNTLSICIATNFIGASATVQLKMVF
jgi:hypothetical protein